MLVEVCNNKNGIPVILDFNLIIPSPNSPLSDPTILIELAVKQLKEKKLIVIDEDLHQAISEFRRVAPPNIPSEYSRLRYEVGSKPVPDWLFKLRTVNTMFDRLISQACIDREQKIHPVVVFFDGCERITTDFIPLIEDFIIYPLILGSQCMFVWLSRKKA